MKKRLSAATNTIWGHSQERREERRTPTRMGDIFDVARGIAGQLDIKRGRGYARDAARRGSMALLACRLR